MQIQEARIHKGGATHENTYTRNSNQLRSQQHKSRASRNPKETNRIKTRITVTKPMILKTPT